MPPKAMWETGDRPRGHEFVSCEKCNRGTSAADSVAAMFSYLRLDGEFSEKERTKLSEVMRSVNKRVPGLGDRLWTKAEIKLTRGKGGVLTPTYLVHVDDAVANEVLGVFDAKVGMALFRQHTGSALPLHGAVSATWFGNAGISKELAEQILSFLPSWGELRAGSNSSIGKFEYKYGSHASGDLVIALASFRNSLHTFTIAAAEEALLDEVSWQANTTSVFRPGTLVDRLRAAGLRTTT